MIAGLLAGRTVIPGLLVDAELRWSLLQRMAAVGRADDAAIDAQLAADPGDAGRRNAAECRAARDPALIRMLRDHQDAVQRALTSRALPGR